MLISIDSLYKTPLKEVSAITIDFDPPAIATVVYGTNASRGTVVIKTKREED